MPKQKVTKDMVLEAAFQLAREQGMEQVLVKKLAQRLNCSTQPIYSYMKNMDEIRQAVEQRTNGFLDRFVRSRIDADDLFRSIGRAHIAFAQEEPHLFEIFIRQARSGIRSFEDLIGKENGVDLYIARQLGISTNAARQLHIHMLIVTVGLGTIYISAKPGISLEELVRQQDLAYEAFLDLARKQK